MIHQKHSKATSFRSPSHTISYRFSRYKLHPVDTSWVSFIKTDFRNLSCPGIQSLRPGNFSERRRSTTSSSMTTAYIIPSAIFNSFLYDLFIYIYISSILVGVSWTHQNTPKSLHLTSIRRDSPPLVSSSFDLRPGMAKSWWSAHLPGDSGERCHGAMPATPWKSVASSIDIPKTCGVSVWSTLGQKKLLSSEMVSLSNSYFGMWSLPYALLCC